MGNSIFKLPTDEHINFVIEEQQEKINMRLTQSQDTIPIKVATSGMFTTINVSEQKQPTIDMNVKANQGSVDIVVREGGGGGGTTNYEELRNKPKINGITLVDNQTLEELGADIHFEIPNNEVLRLWNSVGGNN